MHWVAGASLIAALLGVWFAIRRAHTLLDRADETLRQYAEQSDAELTELPCWGGALDGEWHAEPPEGYRECLIDDAPHWVHRSWKSIPAEEAS